MTNATDLLKAAKSGNIFEVQRLVQDATPNDTFAALKIAAQEGDLECVKILVDPSKYLNTDALCLAAKNGHVQCVQYLIPFSIPHDVQNKALREACFAGHLECVKLLIPVSNFSAHMDPAGALAAAVVGGHHDCMEAVYDLCDAEEELNKMKATYNEDMWGLLDQYCQHRKSQQQKDILINAIAVSNNQRTKKM